MTFGDTKSYDFQGIGFYDHVLDTNYGCDRDDIEKQDFDVIVVQYPSHYEDLSD